MANIRGLQLRAIALPIGVAALSIAALAWYRFMWIPGQETYLNERNLRALQTTAKQIKTKVENFDLAIDHTFESTHDGDQYLAVVKRNLPLLAPELTIIENAEGQKLIPAAEASDPPRIAIERDEGRTVMFLAYQRENRTFYAKADLEDAVRSFLAMPSEFEAVFIVNRRGQVIVPPSTPGLALASLEGLSEIGRSGSPDASNGDAGLTFEKRRGATSVMDVIIGATAYKLYVDPVQLSLKAQTAATPARPKRGEKVEDNAGSDAADEQEEWGICGLARADRFRAASSALVTTYWIWLGLGLASVVLAIPILKLHVLNPRERLRSVDGVIITGASVIVIGLSAFALLDARYFGWVVPSEGDTQLEEVGQWIVANFGDETRAIDSQMRAFDSDRDKGFWIRELNYRPDRVLPELRRELEPVSDKGAPQLTQDVSNPCKPEWACRDALLRRVYLARMKFGDEKSLPYSYFDKTSFPYPYFALAVWSDQDGWQRIKWSTTDITPFLNLGTEKLAYYDEMTLARRIGPEAGTSNDVASDSANGDTDPSGKGVALVQSPNTGGRLTVFWKTLPEHVISNDDGKSDLTGMSLATSPLSLVRPALPTGVQFAVIDLKGNVLHHSDPVNSGTQNLFDECENNTTLRTLVAGRRPGRLDAPYLGRRHRLFVTPLQFPVGAGASPIADPGWTLVVFQETSIQETLNFETLLLASVMFGLYVLGLAIIWALLSMWFPQQIAKWFWPRHEHVSRYTAVVIANVIVSAACLVGFWVWPAARVPMALLGSAAAFGTSFVVLRSGRWPIPAAIPWVAGFFFARAAFLFALAAGPAIACFQTAYDFESQRFVKARRAHLLSELSARDRRIDEEVLRLTLCGDALDKRQSCDAATTYQSRRHAETWDMHFASVTGPQIQSDGREAGDPTWLDAFLMSVHWPSNEFAASLMIEPSDSNSTLRWSEPVVMSRSPFASDRWYWVIVLGVLVVAYVFVRHLLDPLFAREVRETIGTPGGHARSSDNLLLIGPPGSGTIDWMTARAPGVCIVDVRTLVAPKPPTAAPVTGSPAAAPAPVSAALVVDSVSPAGAWPQDLFEALPLAPHSHICIAHLEHRFDESAHRELILELLEELRYRRACTLWIGSVRDPLAMLHEGGEGATPDVSVARWTTLLQSFTIERLRLTHGVSDERLHEAAWMSCSRAEKLALRQLAEEGLVNPNNRPVIERLASAGLVQRAPVAFDVVNASFRNFVLQATPPSVVAAWEREGVRLPWGSIATTLLTVAVGLGALMLLTQEQVLDAWVAYIPAMAPAVPTVLKLLATVRGKPEAEAA
jgi:hypothetical protein